MTINSVLAALRFNLLVKAAFTRQTKVGKLKLVCVNGTKTVDKHVGKLLATELFSVLATFFTNSHVGKLVSDV